MHAESARGVVAFGRQINCMCRDAVLLTSSVSARGEPCRPHMTPLLFKYTNLMLLADVFILAKYYVIYVFITLDTPGGISDHPRYPPCAFAV